MLQQFTYFKNRIVIKQNPPLKIRMGKIAMKKKNYHQLELVVIQIYCFFLNNS